MFPFIRLEGLLSIRLDHQITFLSGTTAPVRYFCFPPSSFFRKPQARRCREPCTIMPIERGTTEIAPRHTPITVLCWPAETNPAKSLHGGLSDEDVVGGHSSMHPDEPTKPPHWIHLGLPNSVDLRSYRHGLRKEGRERSAGSAATRSGIDLRPVESLSVSRYPLSLVQLNDWTAR